MIDLAGAALADVSRILQARDVSATELVREYLARIEAGYDGIHYTEWPCADRFAESVWLNIRQFQDLCRVYRLQAFR